MLNDSQGLSLSIIEDLKGKGFNQSEIARSFGVTRQAVSHHKIKYGGKMTPREVVLREFPWNVPAAQAQSTQYRRMRDHGEFMATGGKGMAADKLNRLRSFYRKLRDENLVVEFDPEIPPEPGVNNKGGFSYRTRVPADGDLLIRVNEHTNLTEQGRMIWRFPPSDP